MVEGPLLVAEALLSDLDVRSIYLDEEFADDLVGPYAEVLSAAEYRDVVPRVAPEGLLAGVLSTVSPQPCAAVVVLPDRRAADVFARPGPLVLLAEVQDPGNAGTIIRAAEATGAGGVLCLPGTVDLYSPKVVRASAGSILRVPTAAVSMDELTLGRGDRRLIGLAMVGSSSLWDAALDDRGVLIAGNEAHGIAAELADQLDLAVSIPMAGDVESLNVAMATTVVLYELVRRRDHS